MSALMIKILIFLTLFGLGWFFGSRHERQHFKHLEEQELALAHIRVSTDRFVEREQHGQMIVANVVLAQDYFKWAWAQVHNFFGGRLKTYESLMERSRREAMVRLKQHAQAIGAHEILGVRLASSEIGDQHGMIEVLAYGTAITTSNNIHH